MTPECVGRYTKKPVTIEAMHLSAYAMEDACAWIGVDAYRRPDETGLRIKTLEGEMHAEIGDWIIKGVKGEFYPCKFDIFRATYGPREETTS